MYPDHFPVILTLFNLPRKQEQKEEKQERWNLARVGGWEKYKEISNKSENKLLEMIENEENTIQEIYEKFEKAHIKMKFSAFGKVTIKTNKDG